MGDAFSVPFILSCLYPFETFFENFGSRQNILINMFDRNRRDISAYEEQRALLIA